MNENILYLGYLIIRLSREEDRKSEGESEINLRIYSMHFEGKINIDIEEGSHKTYNSVGKLNIQEPTIDKEMPKWAKKIEREIVKKTHPDKLLGKEEKEIKEKTEIFVKAKEKVKENNYIDLLPIALSLGIDLSNFGKEFDSSIEKRISDINKKIIEIKSSIGWQWQDFTEDQKIESIDLILKRSGISKSKEEIKKAVNKRIKRKTGERPKSLRETRGL